MLDILEYGSKIVEFHGNHDIFYGDFAFSEKYRTKKWRR